MNVLALSSIELKALPENHEKSKYSCIIKPIGSHKNYNLQIFPLYNEIELSFPGKISHPCFLPYEHLLATENFNRKGLTVNFYIALEMEDTRVYVQYTIEPV